MRCRIPRKAGVLVQKDFVDSKSIFRKMKAFYDKRSDLVHTGKSSITVEDIVTMRHYVRESIEAIYEIGKRKDWWQC